MVKKEQKLSLFELDFLRGKNVFDALMIDQGKVS